ncbi:MAG: PilZ domain-containing protein [Rhodospirillales bacterium]|nr:PilZ domain-containing protein [Rhodospirillales bacterium]MBO6787969.1 PilZ domain-containing protein [Rhodospirillales bacterium]
MSEHRQFDRKSVALAGKIRVEGTDADPTACEILDLSPGGAKVKTGKSLEKGAVVFLQIEKLGEYEADIAWVRKPQVGLKFRAAPDVMAEVVMAIAIYG